MFLFSAAPVIFLRNVPEIFIEEAYDFLVRYIAGRTENGFGGIVILSDKVGQSIPGN